MLKHRAFRHVVKNRQCTPGKVDLGHFQTPLVQDMHYTGTRHVLATTPREAKKSQVEKQGLFMSLVMPSGG